MTHNCFAAAALLLLVARHSLLDGREGRRPIWLEWLSLGRNPRVFRTNPIGYNLNRSAEMTREIVHSEFPDPDRWRHINYARSELRWTDSVRLDQRSAVIISQSIDRALSSLLAGR
jgi:hypothetical protein